MDLHDFNRAISPQLCRKIMIWYETGITVEESQILQAKFKTVMQIATERSMRMSMDLFYSLAAKAEAVSGSKDKFVDLICQVFFLSTAHHYNAEKNSLNSLRICAYEARLKAFLSEMHFGIASQMSTKEEQRYASRAKRQRLRSAPEEPIKLDFSGVLRSFGIPESVQGENT